MSNKGIIVLGVLLVLSVGLTPVFALTELERAPVSNPRIETAFGSPLGNNVNVDQQIQISADITNNQDKSQNFVYLVQIKDKIGFVVSVGWFSGQLTPEQKLSPSLSWNPNESGEFTVEVFSWEGLINHNALSEYVKLQVNVS